MAPVARSDDPELVRRFVREAEIAMKVRGPNLVGVRDVGAAPDGSAYIAMVLLDGNDLASLLRASATLPLEHCVVLVVRRRLRRGGARAARPRCETKARSCSPRSLRAGPSQRDVAHRDRRSPGRPRKIARADLVAFDVRVVRLVGLAGLLAIASGCSSTEEAHPPPLRTSPAADRTKPAEGQSTELKDANGNAIGGEEQPGGGSGFDCAKSGLTTGAGQKHSLAVGSDTRTYVLSVPQGYGELPRKWRLVFAFHGGGGGGDTLRNWYDAEQRFAEKNAIVVYPDAKNGQWDLDSAADANADIAFFDALVADISSKACIDTARVFAVGFSNGAYFANQLACRRGGVLRAIAPHAGGGPYGPGSSYDAQGNLVCTGTPPAVKIFHAEDDYTVPISHAEASINHWKWANGCQESTHGAAPDPCAAYDGCGRPVEVCRYWGVGHSIWSEGAKATWEFFAGF